jgi:hypothetical protein
VPHRSQASHWEAAQVGNLTLGGASFSRDILDIFWIFFKGHNLGS